MKFKHDICIIGGVGHVGLPLGLAFAKEKHGDNYFLKLLNENIIFYDDENYTDDENCKKYENKLKKNNIEFRRGNAGSGNQLRQPYLSKYISTKNIKFKFKNVDHVHFFGYYIGNYPSLKREKIKKLCKIINSV